MDGSGGPIAVLWQTHSLVTSSKTRGQDLVGSVLGFCVRFFKDNTAASGKSNRNIILRADAVSHAAIMHLTLARETDAFHRVRATRDIQEYIAEVS